MGRVDDPQFWRRWRFRLSFRAYQLFCAFRVSGGSGLVRRGAETGAEHIKFVLTAAHAGAP